MSLTLQIQAQAQTTTRPQAASAAAAIPRNADGSINFSVWRAGTTLKQREEQIESLSEEEYAACVDWLQTENSRKEAQIAKNNTEFVATLKTIHQLTGGKLDQALVVQAKKVLQDPSVADSLKVELRKLLN